MADCLRWRRVSREGLDRVAMKPWQATVEECASQELAISGRLDAAHPRSFAVIFFVQVAVKLLHVTYIYVTSDNDK